MTFPSKMRLITTLYNNVKKILSSLLYFHVLPAPRLPGSPDFKINDTVMISNSKNP